MKSSFCIDLQRFMLIPTNFPLTPSLPFLEKSLHAFILPVYQCVKVNFPLFFPSPVLHRPFTSYRISLDNQKG